MNSIKKQALQNYKLKVKSCVSLANNIISSRIDMINTLAIYNQNIYNIKNAIENASNILKCPNFLQEEISLLEKSRDYLNQIIEEAQLSTIGKLGVAFDELRYAAKEVRRTIKEDAESAAIFLACHNELNDVCESLIKNCITDAASLRAIGIPD